MTARSSVIKEIVSKSAPAGEETVREAMEQERQARTRPSMLGVVLKNGDEWLLSYTLFRHALKCEGGRKWELVFDDYQVLLTGRNLGDKLRDLLRLQKLSFLREGNQVEGDLVGEDEAFIESIEIREKGDES